MTATDNEMQDRLGLGPEDLIENILERLLQREWTRITLSFLHQAGLLDRRKAVEAMREYALVKLNALQQSAKEAQAYIEAGDPNAKLSEDMPPALQWLAVNIVQLGSRDTDAKAVAHAEESVEDFCLWYIAELKPQPETPEQERTVHVPLTRHLMERLINDDVRQALAERIRGKGA